MQITVNGRDIALNFGIRFVRELDAKYHFIMKDGKRIGTGLEETVPMLLTGNVLVLEDVIRAAAWKEEKKPSNDELDDFIDSVEDIDALFKSVLDELKKQNATRKRTLVLVAELEKQQKREEERKKVLKTLMQTEKTLKSNTKN